MNKSDPSVMRCQKQANKALEQATQLETLTSQLQNILIKKKHHIDTPTLRQQAIFYQNNIRDSEQHYSMRKYA